MATRNPHADASFGLDDLLAIARRRLFWLVVPTLLGAGLGLALALLMAPVYEAESILVVRPQSVSQDLVGKAGTRDVEALFGQVRLLITARDRLAELIEELDLYPELADRPLEERVALMRSDIEIQPLPPAIVDPRKPLQVESLRIAFRSNDPAVVAQVANRLTADFRTRAIEITKGEAEGSTEFFQRQIAERRQELERVGAELASYREQYRGQLPDDLGSNREGLERDATQRARVQAQVDLARSRTRDLESELEKLRASSAETSPALRARQLELELRVLAEKGYTDKHPDVALARAEIKALQDAIDAGEANMGTVPPAERKLAAEIRDLRTTTRQLDRELAMLDAAIAAADQRMQGSSRHAVAVSRLAVQYENLEDQIEALEGRKQQADLAAEIEREGKAQQFRTIQTAETPAAPVEPNRPLCFAVGVMLGALLGLLAVALLEIADQSIHSVSELQKLLDVPVLAAIPDIRKVDLERSRARGAARV